jgi:DNA polymerase-1
VHNSNGENKMRNVIEFHENNQKVMLVDGDLLAYKITSSLEEPIDWGNDVWTLHSDLKVGKDLWTQQIEYYKNYTHSKEVIICFSDKENYRKHFEPTYKSYRKTIRKPVTYSSLRDWIKKNYKWISFPKLEGDDVLGLLATGSYKTNNVVISGDKDMRTIPTWHVFIGDDSLELVDETKADLNFCTQVLTGDQADGYKGCVGVGAVKASRVLLGKKTLEEMWEAVVLEYERNKQSFEDAYHQARLARILRNGEYNFLTHEPTLWSFKYEHYRDTRQGKKAS